MKYFFVPLLFVALAAAAMNAKAADLSCYGKAASDRFPHKVWVHGSHVSNDGSRMGVSVGVGYDKGTIHWFKPLVMTWDEKTASFRNGDVEFMFDTEGGLIVHPEISGGKSVLECRWIGVRL